MIRKIKVAPRVRPETPKVKSNRKTEPKKRRIPLETQFSTKYKVTDIFPTLITGEKATTPCWRWFGANNGKAEGKWYGIFGRPKMYAHRYAYERYVGPIPEGHVIDHRCRHRWCVNPDHLKAVTNVMNLKLGAHPNFVSHRTGKCARGLHDLNNPENVYLRADGRAFCKPCSKIARDNRPAKPKGNFKFVEPEADKKKNEWGLM